METIKRDDLKNRLIEEGYIQEYGIDATIDNLLALDGEAKNLFHTWFKTGKVEKFNAIEGIDRQCLRDMGMKDPAIILAYGALLKAPKRNSALLKRPMRKYVSSHK